MDVGGEMQSLEDFNRERAKVYDSGNEHHRWNGIACPKCDRECFDSTPNITLTSYPPQKNISCSKCDYTGYRIA